MKRIRQRIDNKSIVDEDYWVQLCAELRLYLKKTVNETHSG